MRTLTALFISSWNTQTDDAIDVERYLSIAPPAQDVPGFAAPFGDGPPPLYKDRIGKNVLLGVILSAVNYVYITTPYLILDSELQSVLTTCAKSGVDVRILTPAVPDKKLVFHVTRSNYEPLLDAGVRIFEYSPGFLHAKNFVCDDRYAVVGSVNLDFRSLFLHYECGVWLCDDPAVEAVREDFLATQDLCREIRAEDLPRRRMLGRVALSILRIFSPMM